MNFKQRDEESATFFFFFFYYFFFLSDLLSSSSASFHALLPSPTRFSFSIHLLSPAWIHTLAGTADNSMEKRRQGYCPTARTSLDGVYILRLLLRVDSDEMNAVAVRLIDIKVCNSAKTS